MCSIILRIAADGILIGANRDEMIARPWEPPAAHWPATPGIIAGRDTLAGGTWMGLNQHGVMAAILNRSGTLGPAQGKRSRGELPLMALTEATAQDAAAKILTVTASDYRSFNLVIADAISAYFIRGLDSTAPEIQKLPERTWMITSGEPNDFLHPRIARHLPRFETAGADEWPVLLADNAMPVSSALNVPPTNGFGTVCSAVLTLPKSGAPTWLFAAGPPDKFPFELIA